MTKRLTKIGQKRDPGNEVVTQTYSLDGQGKDDRLLLVILSCPSLDIRLFYRFHSSSFDQPGSWNTGQLLVSLVILRAYTGTVLDHRSANFTPEVQEYVDENDVLCGLAWKVL